MASLAQKLRPNSLEDYIGQAELLGQNGSLSHYIKGGKLEQIPSLILWGPPGVGKTTLAKILIKKSGRKPYEFSGALDSIKDIKSQVDGKYRSEKAILFLDEIHRFLKTQQDYLLDLLDRNVVTLIGATTENPSFSLSRALLSRCVVMTLHKHGLPEVVLMLQRGLKELNKERETQRDFSKASLEYLAKKSNGDLRNGLKLLELVFTLTESDLVETDDVKKCLSSLGDGANLINYDVQGDNHYDTISAFHKSIRGSDADASVYYLMRMLKGGDDPLFVARRMIRIASEDIGLVDNSCLGYCCGVYESVLRLGMPKCLNLMVECAVRLAQSPKSVEIYRGWKKARELVQSHKNMALPAHMSYSSNEIEGKSLLPEELSRSPVLLNRHLGELIDEPQEESDSENEDLGLL